MSKSKSAPPAEIEPAGTVADNGVALYGRWFPAKVDGLAGVKHTLDLTTERGKALLVKAGSPGDINLSDTGHASLIVCDVAVFWDSEVDEETGEVREFPRTVFYDANGQTFRSSSPHAPHFVARLVDVYGMERLREGIRVHIEERVSRREKRRYHNFSVDMPE